MTMLKLLLCTLLAATASQSLAQSVPSTLPTTMPVGLQAGWEDVDKRFQDLVLQLAACEDELGVVRKSLKMAGYRLSIQEAQADRAERGNEALDRNGGMPVDWRRFYSRTSAKFFYRPNGDAAQRSWIILRDQQGNPQGVIQGRPPEWEFIYRANDRAQQRATQRAVELQKQREGLLDWRRDLEKRQELLWLKIAARGAVHSEAARRPTYRFHLVVEREPDREAAINACTSFVRGANQCLAEITDLNDKVDIAGAVDQVRQFAVAARADLDEVLLKQATLVSLLENQNSTLGRFYLCAERYADSAKSLTEFQQAAWQHAQRSEEDGRLRARELLQQSSCDLADTVFTLNELLDALRNEWSATPDVARTVPAHPTILKTVETAPDLAAQEGVAGANTTVDLLKLIDPDKHTVGGHWFFRDGTLVSDASGWARIEIPYRPPQEYDFELVFTRKSGSAAVQICVGGGHAWMWQVGGWGNRFAGFENINGQGAEGNNPTKVALAIHDHQRYTSLVKVRKEGVEAYLDGGRLSAFRTDYANLRIDPSMQLTRDSVLGIGAGSAVIVIHSAKVVEVSGRGEVLSR